MDLKSWSEPTEPNSADFFVEREENRPEQVPLGSNKLNKAEPPRREPEGGKNIDHPPPSNDESKRDKSGPNITDYLPLLSLLGKTDGGMGGADIQKLVGPLLKGKKIAGLDGSTISTLLPLLMQSGILDLGGAMKPKGTSAKHINLEDYKRID